MPIGNLGVRDYDLGCFLTVGGQMVSYDVDGDIRNAYAVLIPGVVGSSSLGGMVPLYFVAAEDTQQELHVPCIRFTRTGILPGQTQEAWYGYVSRVPSGTAVTADVGVTGGEPVIVEGSTSYKSRWRSERYDISYDAMAMARTQRDMLLIESFVMNVMRHPGFSFVVIDSLGDRQLYDAVDVSHAYTGGLSGVQDRRLSKVVSFTVRAGIDLGSEHEAKALTSMPQFEIVEGV